MLLADNKNITAAGECLLTDFKNVVNLCWKTLVNGSWQTVELNDLISSWKYAPRHP